MSICKATLTVAAVFAVPPAFLGLPDAETCATPQKPKEQTWTDPAKAAADDPDFLIQGEYGAAKPGAEWGLQVVALGAGDFDAYLLEAGLPGAGWTKEKSRTKLSGRRENRAAKLMSEDQCIAVTISDGKASIVKDGQPLATLPRIERKSATLGAEPPSDAIVLFDGSSADEWIKGRVENGLLPNNDVTTKRRFGDYTLHIEFRTPYKPHARGQGRGNSGVYHQGRYETQVLDSFGLAGEQNETGGIYSIAAPLLNMCYPPLSWQTYDVNFTAARFDEAGNLVKPARITVRLNGVVVQSDVSLAKTTTAAPLNSISPTPGPLFIQHHGNPVYYRNIWIVPK